MAEWQADARLHKAEQLEQAGCHVLQEGLSNAKKSRDDKKLQAVASRREKLEDRLGMEKNAKGHRLRVNRHAPPCMVTMPSWQCDAIVCPDAQACTGSVLMWHADKQLQGPLAAGMAAPWIPMPCLSHHLRGALRAEVPTVRWLEQGHGGIPS